MKAVIYCRVSDPRQALTLSLGTQEQACRDYCRREGYEVDALFVEPYNANTTDRPNL
jgi:DNA invertase Pin-like site-specific DNA recombinase